jgi:hypothetical protein
MEQVVHYYPTSSHSCLVPLPKKLPDVPHHFPWTFHTSEMPTLVVVYSLSQHLLVIAYHTTRVNIPLKNFKSVHVVSTPLLGAGKAS